MQDPETTTTFAGLDGRTDTELPSWFAATQDHPETVAFSAAIWQRPRATETAITYRNPYTQEWVETSRFNALVEPSRLVAHDEDTQTPLFHVPTDSYAVIKRSGTGSRRPPPGSSPRWNWHQFWIFIFLDLAASPRSI